MKSAEYLKGCLSVLYYETRREKQPHAYNSLAAYNWASSFGMLHKKGKSQATEIWTTSNAWRQLQQIIQEYKT